MSSNFVDYSKIYESKIKHMELFPQCKSQSIKYIPYVQMKTISDAIKRILCRSFYF